MRSLPPSKLCVVKNTCDLRVPEVEAGGLEVYGHPSLHDDFKASLGYMRLCLKTKISQREGPNSNIRNQFVHIIGSFWATLLTSLEDHLSNLRALPKKTPYGFSLWVPR